jgi:site-specific recombinase XerD
LANDEFEDDDAPTGDTETPPAAPLTALLAPGGAAGAIVFPEAERAVNEYVSRQLSHRSKQNALDALRRLTRLLLRDDSAVPGQIAWPSIDFAKANQIRAVLYEATRAGAISPGTANITLSHFRGLLREMYGLKLIDADQLALLQSNALKKVPGKRTARGRALTGDEETALRKAAQALSGPYRGAMLDAAIVLAIGAGLRREEVAWITTVGAQSSGLRFIGKGNKERFVPIS